MVSAPVRPSVVSPQVVSEPVVSSIPWCRRGPSDRRGVRGACGPSWSVVVSVVESKCLNLILYRGLCKIAGPRPSYFATRKVDSSPNEEFTPKEVPGSRSKGTLSSLRETSMSNFVCHKSVANSGAPRPSVKCLRALEEGYKSVLVHKSLPQERKLKDMAKQPIEYIGRDAHEGRHKHSNHQN